MRGGSVRASCSMIVALLLQHRRFVARRQDHLMRRAGSTSRLASRVADAGDDLLDQREVGLGFGVALALGCCADRRPGREISASAGHCSLGMSAQRCCQTSSVTNGMKGCSSRSARSSTERRIAPCARLRGVAQLGLRDLDIPVAVLRPDESKIWRPASPNWYSSSRRVASTVRPACG